MLATSERIELLDSADELAKMILESDVVEQYQISLYKLQHNRESQRKIKRFVSVKDLYEDVQRFGKYHPDYKKIMTEVRECKREMDLDPLVADFKLAENDLQTLLDKVSILIGGAVSEHIKVPTGNPFFDTGHSCSGGCGSGSCG
ncbi:regulator [Bacillus sp. MUM 116]|uniref:YlbF family regulator n=1 Tax=Bacillus sp. MUM 116 TaxID=1678002 RepID=UPI0008F5C87F|nr:YlbF family regulator [Bacillus sp. MUM 116]OIK14062.1 regulator [Bacillus sp. MUM 116]